MSSTCIFTRCNTFIYSLVIRVFLDPCCLQHKFKLLNLKNVCSAQHISCVFQKAKQLFRAKIVIGMYSTNDKVKLLSSRLHEFFFNLNLN